MMYDTSLAVFDFFKSDISPISFVIFTVKSDKFHLDFQLQAAFGPHSLRYGTSS